MICLLMLKSLLSKINGKWKWRTSVRKNGKTTVQLLQRLNEVKLRVFNIKLIIRFL